MIKQNVLRAMSCDAVVCVVVHKAMTPDVTKLANKRLVCFQRDGVLVSATGLLKHAMLNNV